MSRKVFVTTELFPETAGGAGVVINSLADSLAETSESLVLLLVTSSIEPEQRAGFEVVTASIPEHGFLERSEAAAEAILSIIEEGDEVEVQDFEGIAFHALATRTSSLLARTPTTVRFHGPYDLLAEAMDAQPDDWTIPRAMEAEVFRMADRVIVPAQGHKKTLVDRYGVDPGRVAVGPPEVPSIPRRLARVPEVPTFAVVGRLGEMKGSQDMVEAALRVLRSGIDMRVRFIGEDGWSPSTSSGMRERLESSIPGSHADAFDFVGAVPRDRLPEELADATAVIIPSRFESFCLAAHEARQMGIPVVVAEIDAFIGLFDETTGATSYDGSVEGLADALRRLAVEPDLATSLAGRPAPVVADSLATYDSPPSVRHEREQAGLATAATQRLESVVDQPNRSGTPLLQRIYRYLPTPVADAARRFAPRQLRELAGGKASWPAEQARRDLEARLAAVERRIDAGDYAPRESPDVSVIVPVFDSIEFLDEALASVYEQDHQSWEIVVVDDGSTDPITVEYLNRLERPRLRIIRQENKGLAAARNAGIAVARGRYVIPLDSDDELEESFMSRTLEALEASPRAAYAHCYARLYHDIDALWITRPFNPYWQLLGNGVVGCVLLRKDAVEEAGGYDETMRSGNEDWELWLRLFALGWDQVQVPELLFRYRKHGVSMSVDTEARFEEGRRMVRDRHPDLYDSKGFRALKSEWYPMLTALADTELTHPDVETVTSEEDLASTWGKYVVDLRDLDLPPLEKALELAELLEENPDLARVSTAGAPPLVVHRRWSLHDPAGGPSGELVVDDRTRGGSDELVVTGPRSGWRVPDLALDVTIQRQPPEESGRLPHPEDW